MENDNEANPYFDEVASELMKETPKISEAAKNLLSEVIANCAVKKVDFDPVEALGTVQLVLKGIRSMPLLEPSEWIRKNPQEDEQSGLERMEQVTRYKVSYALWKRSTSSGQSPSKLLGRSFLQVVWPQVRQYVEKKHPQNSTTETILEAFQSSLTDVKDLDVSWARNMIEVVEQRHQERKKQAEERMERAQDHLKAEIMEQLES